MLPSQFRTPGVYVSELSGFSASIIANKCAVPLFIGYTETAEYDGQPMGDTPQRIGSLAEYTAFFGRLPPPQFALIDGNAEPHGVSYQNETGLKHLRLIAQHDPMPLLPASIRMFFDNGGTDCLVRSVGDFAAFQQHAKAEADADAKADAKAGGSADHSSDAGSTANPTRLKRLTAALSEAVDCTDATLLVIPDARRRPSVDDFGALAQAMLAQANTLRTRFAVLDVFGTETLDPASGNLAEEVEALVDNCRAQLGDDNLGFGASYFPDLQTSAVQAGDYDLRIFAADDLADHLNAQAQVECGAAQLAKIKPLLTSLRKDSLSEAAARQLTKKFAEVCH